MPEERPDFRELCALNTNFKGAPLAEDSNIQEGDQLIVTKQEALLEVRITKVETREEEIPFGTETTQSNEYTKGTTKTLQEGENGLRRVTMQNVYDTNGVLLEQTILSTETIREPVNKKVVVGTKKVTKNGAAAYIGGSGQFIWPVPGYRNCSRWYGSGHKGVDICASAGTPIYASAGGTVTKAGYNKAGAGTGYGYSVIISTPAAIPRSMPTACLWRSVRARPCGRASSSAMWAARAALPATTATSRSAATARTSHRRACSPESDKSEQNLSGNAKHKLGSPIRQQRRPPPVADEGRRCWGSGQQDTSAILCTKWTLGAATRMLA